MYLAFQNLHGPVQAPLQYVEPYSFIEDKKRRIYAGMMAALDEAIGNVTQALMQRGMWDNTLVILTSDNGGPTETCETNGSQNKGLKGGKCSITEGGTRVEAFVSGGALPADVAGKPMHLLMHGVDWLPTLAEVAGIDASDSLTNLPLDGVSHWSNLQEQDGTEMRQEIFYGYSDGYPLKRPGSAIRNLRWKLIRGKDTKDGPIRRVPGANGYCTPNCVNCTLTRGYTGLDRECPKGVHTAVASPRHLAEEERSTMQARGTQGKTVQLFDLLVDPAETTDVSLEQPEILKELTERLNFWEAETYLAPDQDPARSPECPKQPNFPNHDGPLGVPVLLPWCDLSSGAMLV